MSKKILVVEDEKNIAELERDYLEANGYTVEMEFDGKSGLDKALGSDYDLVILDVMLPGIDGFEVCRQIRKHKECPVLMVSAKKDEIDKIRGLGLGADDYITKPFSPSELVARVTAHISRYERLTSKGEEPVNYIINVGKLSIDTHARRVFRQRERGHAHEQGVRPARIPCVKPECGLQQGCQSSIKYGDSTR